MAPEARTAVCFVPLLPHLMNHLSVALDLALVPADCLVTELLLLRAVEVLSTILLVTIIDDNKMVSLSVHRGQGMDS